MCNRDPAGGKCQNTQREICDRNAVKAVNGNISPHRPKVLKFTDQELEAADWSIPDKSFVIFLNERRVPREVAENGNCWLQTLLFDKQT